MTAGFLQDKSKYFLLALIFVSGTVLYLPSVYVEFVSDEIAFISRNKVDSPAELPAAFAQKDYDGDYYRPIGNFVSSLLTLAGGYNTEFYRLFNLMLNAVNGIILFLFLSRFLKDHERKELIALFSALFFVPFPLNDYAVIWHTDLFDRVMTFFYLLSLIFFLKESKVSVWSLLFFLLALLTKEMAFSLPFVILLLAYVRNSKISFKNSVSYAIPYMAVLLLLILFRWIIFGNNLFNLQDAHAGTPLTGVIKNLVLFWGMLVFPFFLRETQELISSSPSILIITLPLIAAVLYYWFKYRRYDLLILLLVLLITVTILPASRLLMRWYLYLPSAFFTAFLAYLLFSSLKLKTSLFAALAIFTVYYAYTLYRQSLWTDISAEGKSAVSSMLLEYNKEINDAGKLYFLTVPAKVNDISLFQLGFDHHLNYYLGDKKQIFLLTKSYFEDINGETISSIFPDSISIMHTGDNYFMLSGNEKNIKFMNEESGSRFRKIIYHKKEKEPDDIFFTFSKGKFHLIKDSE